MSNQQKSNKRQRQASGATGEPAQKKQKTQGQQRRQRKRRAQRNGRAQTGRGGRQDKLAGRGQTQNRSGYGNKASMPIWESEYIAEITPSAEPGFSLQQFPVNPGQAATFPWLARIAQNFEKYEFEFLRFCYRREVSEFATNGVTGKVIMSFDSDATDPAPTTKQQMLDTDPHADGMPCESFELEIPKDILKKLNDAHFVRPGAQPANTDLKTYDIGTLNVACQGTAANTVVGELHAEYALRLRVPILENTAGQFGVMTAAAATVASPMLAGVASGPIPITQALTVITFTNLTVGQEYLVEQLWTTNAVNATYGTLTGWTLVTNLLGNGTSNGGGGYTATATATTATVTITMAGGAPGKSVLTILPILGTGF